MRRRARPHRHYRRIRTRKGVKQILINPKIKKYKAKKIGVIGKNERRIFNHISSSKNYGKEFGGGLDFNKSGKLETFSISPGTMYQVDLPDDFEAQYHTHPHNWVNPPSPEDIEALINNENQQAEIVFRNGNAFTVIKTPSTRALSKLPATQLKQLLDRAFLSSRASHDWEKKYKENLEKLGFIVVINNKPKSALDVKIVPKEPFRGGTKWD